MTTLSADTSRAVRSWIPTGVSRAQKLSTAAVVLILASLAVRAWVSTGSWFYGDDLEWLSTVARGEASVRWLFEAHDSQFMPLGLALAWVTGASGAYAWWVAALQMLLLQAAASFACWRMLVALFGQRPEILALLTLYLFSTLTVPTATWWAVSLNQLPLHLVLFASVTCHVQYLRTRAWRHLAWASGWLVLGYLAYVKTLLVVFVLAAVTVLYFTTGHARRRVLDALRSSWPAWTSYGILTAAYLVVYVAYVPNPVATQGRVDYGRLADSLVRESLGPGLVGGPWRWADANPPMLTAAAPQILVLASWLVLAAVAVFLLATRRRAWRVLLIAVPYLAVTLYLVGEGRAYILGASAGAEFRYLSDFAALVPLLAGLAWLPLRGAAETVERRTEIPAVPRRRTLIVAGSALVVASAAVSTVPYASAWHDDYTTRAFIAHARSSLAAAPEPPTLADEPIPVDQVGSLMLYPFNQPSYLLAPIASSFTTTTAGNDLATLGPDGTLAAAVVTQGLSTPLGDATSCGRVVSDRETVRLSNRTLDYRFWMRIGYLSGAPGTMAVDAGDNHAAVRVERGLHSIFVRTNGVYDRVTLTPADGTALCIDRIDVGPLESRPLEP